MDPNFKYQPILIESSEDFWALFDALCDDKSEFFNHRRTILDAFKNGKLYGMTLEEDDYLWDIKPQLDPRNNPLFCRDCSSSSLYLFPMLCIIEKDDSYQESSTETSCIIIWNHTRNRRKGLAKKLVQLLNINKIHNPLQGSLHFWKACEINTLKN